MSLTREQILDSQDLGTVQVSVPQWGGEVPIREWSGVERNRFQELVKDKAPAVGIPAILTTLSVVDEGGNRMFRDTDLTTVAGKSAAALEVISDAVIKLNRIGQQEEDAAEKNSDPGQTG
ncbi:hypothetical protein [Candidatus Magnetaquicoccus inordinatus]|uniref:hypothetical protein n=1 Tax=Candidatus Magnetaquicoccus inordinatus TaxID=2496818 RepID=UPI00102C98FD|nr:hypothetical protein [Candidatus Magnetaquicoccus inordinatus]